MSTKGKGKKSSAFASYMSRKASSLSDVSSGNPEDEILTKRLASANGTPSGSLTSLSSRNSTHGSKLSLASIMSAPARFSSEKKKKSERKKIKELFKSSKGGARPSWLPDSAVDSPISGLNGNVTLKSMRPKTSMVNLNSNLPIKTDPSLTPGKANKPKVPSREDRASPSAIVESTYTEGATPPVPPRKPTSRAKKSTVPPKPARKNLPEFTPPLPPKQARKGSSDEGYGSRKTPRTDDDSDSSLRPAKQRRLSSGAASPHDKSKTSLSMMNGSGSKQNREMPYMYDSQDEAKRLMECLIHPIKLDKFFNDLFERTPLLVKRHMPSYYDGWFSTAQMDQILREHNIQFTENLDVVSYTDGKRETHNPVGRAYAPVVWDYFQNGCSVRLMNPQTYSRSVWKLLSILQEFFNCNVGANVYLTPPGTQGFAPHYDDIEAFIIQLEGKKHWRLYHPRTKAETLPRYSSGNFSEDEIGEPMLDVILEAGDLLYFPRGLIHQGKTLEDAHSLHMTVSACQLNSWGDYLQKLLPAALEVAMTEDIDFRKSLPKEYLHHLGIAYSDSDSKERIAFLRNVEKLMTKLLSHAPVDAAVDQMGSKFIHDSLPPVLTKTEKFCSIHGNGERWDEKTSRVRGAIELEPDTEVKLIRKGIIRLVKEGDKLNIYHSLENSRLYHEVEPQYIEVSEELAPGLEHLLKVYPAYITVDSLPLDSVDDKMGLISELYEKGLVMTKKPLEHLSETSSEDEDDL